MQQLLCQNVLQAIGNTPLVKLNKIVPANCADVYVKLEYFNPTGSYKDRMALSIIEEAEVRGDIHPGDTIVEFTGGSTGTSLAFICAIKGYRFKVVSSNAFAKEKLKTIRLFGAQLEVVHAEEGKITPGLFVEMEERVAKIMSSENAYWTRQFTNTDVLIGYRKLGNEIISSLDSIDVFCAAVGTGGMFTGVSSVLKNHNVNTRIIALEPSSSATLSTGAKGSHRIEGVASGRIPPLLANKNYDEAKAYEESDARNMAKQLAATEGIFAGTSTGLNVFAAIQMAKELGIGKTVVTIACDSGMKYLAGDLFD